MNKPRRLPATDAPALRIPVAISSRHVHLTQGTTEQLFCDRYRLHANSAPGQAGEFCALETVTLVGPSGRIRNVRVIGPARSFNQVEISRTDAVTLGIQVPVRESGDLRGTPGVIIEGPRTQVTLGDRRDMRAAAHPHESRRRRAIRRAGPRSGRSRDPKAAIGAWCSATCSCGYRPSIGWNCIWIRMRPTPRGCAPAIMRCWQGRAGSDSRPAAPRRALILGVPVSAQSQRLPLQLHALCVGVQVKDAVSAIMIDEL